MADEPISEVLRELRGINARLDGVRAEMATRADLAAERAALEALRADHGAALEALRDGLAKLTGEVETLGRDIRRGWAELRRDLPRAVVEAIAPLYADVAQLKRAAGL